MALKGFKINHSAIQEYLDGGHGVEAMLDREAEDRANRARSNAPVVSGDYQSSIHVETVHTDRMVKRVVADVTYALKVEADHGTLARSL